VEFSMKKRGGFYTELSYGRLSISGDEKNGFLPSELLIASIAGCSGEVLRSILKKMRFHVEEIKIQTTVRKNPDQANRIEEIFLHFIIKGSHLDQAKIKRALQLVKKHCSMVQSVLGSIHVEETFEIIDSFCDQNG
jgi:putative redox protein